jgi:hypothetical protein
MNALLQSCRRVVTILICLWCAAPEQCSAPTDGAAVYFCIRRAACRAWCGTRVSGSPSLISTGPRAVHSMIVAHNTYLQRHGVERVSSLNLGLTRVRQQTNNAI